MEPFQQTIVLATHSDEISNQDEPHIIDEIPINNELNKNPIDEHPTSHNLAFVHETFPQREDSTIDEDDTSSEFSESDQSLEQEELSKLEKTAMEMSFNNAPLSEFQALFTPNCEAEFQADIQSVLNNSTILRILVVSHRIEIVRFVLQQGMQLDESVMAFALKTAKEKNDKTILSLLFEYGWEINRPVNDHTPPAMSLLLENEDWVRWCLSLGASPSASSPSGDTVMHRAVSYAPLKVVKLLVEHGGVVKNTNLLAHAVYSWGQALSEERLDVAKYLLDHGARVDAFWAENRNSEVPTGDLVFVGEMNALHFAIVSGKEEVVELLLEHGADRNLKTRSSWKTNWEMVSCVELARLCKFENRVAGD